MIDDKASRASIAMLYMTQLSFLSFNGENIQGTERIMERLEKEFDGVVHALKSIDAQPTTVEFSFKLWARLRKATTRPKTSLASLDSNLLVTGYSSSTTCSGLLILALPLLPPDRPQDPSVSGL